MLTDGFFRSDCYVKVDGINAGDGLAYMVNFLKDINIVDQRLNSTFPDVNFGDLQARTTALLGGSEAGVVSPSGPVAAAGPVLAPVAAPGTVPAPVVAPGAVPAPVAGNDQGKDHPPGD